MSQIFVIGRVTADLELKTSATQNPYVRFDVAERIGNRQNFRTQFFQTCAWGGDAQRLSKAGVKKGSLIWISGSLELEEFVKRDGQTKDKRLKVLLDNWGFVPVGKAKGSDGARTNDASEMPAPVFEAGIDGDRDPLPE